MVVVLPLPPFSFMTATISTFGTPRRERSMQAESARDITHAPRVIPMLRAEHALRGIYAKAMKEMAFMALLQLAHKRVLFKLIDDEA